MDKSSLAKNYANEKFKIKLFGFEISLEKNKIFTKKDVEKAFNAGRESLIKNIPNLEWKDGDDRRGDEVNYIEESYSLTPFGDYSILRWYFPTDIMLYFNGEHLKSGLISIQQAKQIATEDYKNKIKQTLGL